MAHPLLSRRVLGIETSATMAVVQQAQQLQAQGQDVINLGAGESDFPTPDHIKKAGIKAIEDNKTAYTAVAGLIELRKAICQKFEHDNRLHYTPEQITVTTGGKQAIFNAIMASINPDDEVLIPSPYWVSYPDIVKFAQGIPVFLPTTQENNFKITAQQLQEALTPKTKWLILNSPSNPTGSGYSTKELLEIANVIDRHPSVHILSDEIYEFIVYDNFQSTSIATVYPAIKDRVLIVNGLSKAYSMTGWRIGYAAGHLSLIQAMNKVQSQSTTHATTPAQVAAIQALTHGKDFLKERNQAFLERRNFLIQKINATKYLSCNTPQGAFYLLISCEKCINLTTQDGIVLKNDIDFCSSLLKEEKVATVPGSAFGLSLYFRISYALDLPSLKKAMQRIEKFTLTLK